VSAASHAAPDVSVVFETENEDVHHRIRLADVLEAWLRQTRVSRVAEWIIVSGRPPLGEERRLIEAMRARWLEEPGGRYYGLKNRGVLESKGAYVALADADAAPDADWLEAALAALQSGGPSVALVTGRTRYLSGPFSREFALAVWPHLADAPRDTSEILAHNALARAEVLRRFVFETVQLRHGADSALARRLIEAGYRVRYDPSLRVTHNYTRRLRDLWPEARYLGWNYAQIDEVRGCLAKSSLRNAFGRFRVLAGRLASSRRIFGIPLARLPLSLLFYGYFCAGAARGYAAARSGKPELAGRF
jgi:hypothetical protein